MSPIYSRPLGAGCEMQNGTAVCGTTDGAPRTEDTADRAIDAALRAVPLPDGLMARLGLLVDTMAEGAQDQADWLGC